VAATNIQPLAPNVIATGWAVDVWPSFYFGFFFFFVSLQVVRFTLLPVNPSSGPTSVAKSKPAQGPRQQERSSESPFAVLPEITLSFIDLITEPP